MLTWQPKSPLGTEKGSNRYKGIYKELLSKVIVNVTTKKLAGELKGDFFRTERDKFSIGD